MRWRTFAREPGSMSWTLGLPVALSLALGLAFRNEEPAPEPAVVQESPRAEHVRDVLAKSRELTVKVLPEREANEALRTGKVHVVVVPDDSVGGAGKVTYRFDPTRPESRLTRILVDDALQRGEGRADPVQTAAKTVTEPGSRYIDFLIPGLVGMGLMSSGLWGIGFGLAEMRTRKLLKRLVATPMHKSDFILSFLLVRAGLLAIELPPILIFAYFVFHVGVSGSLLALILVSLVGSLVFAGMGLLFASRSENLQVVSGLINVSSFPMYLCSGVFFSTARFPEWIQPLVKYLPLTALIDGLRAVMVDGAGFAQLASPIAIMAGWGVIIFWGTMKLFRWH